eukprot:TRINITY_DN3175_c0_g3_i2.p2 TRINITY_DN3175_c0_g3~~TRINITY_DN3175_c0_g3_i2.p2  ORF type:complete len:182 (-),score=40.12 TRINITY_DN3175_c0_g3_i2:494-982(-)
MIKAVLEQAGIEKDMTLCQCNKKNVFIVSFMSARVALVCVKHFNGRQWSGPAAPPVVAERLPSSTHRDKVAPPKDGLRSSMPLKELIRMNPPPAFFRPPPGLSLGREQSVPAKDQLTSFSAGMVPKMVQKKTVRFAPPRYDDDCSTDAGSSQEGDAEMSIFL